ncbi:MAG: enolase C-terminal domain-like protein [Acidobacteriota bacterium]
MPRIEAILTERLLVPVRKEWAISGSAGTHDQSPFLLIRLKAEGLEGLGEVSGTYGWSGEGFETAEAAVRNVLTPALVGRDAAPNQIRLAMDKVLAGFPFTKAGIEMACWDLAGKACGRSVSALLGGSIRTSIVSKFSISGGAADRSASIARQAWEAGFRKFKVKVGTGLESDLERVAAVRRALGEGVSLGVDANGGWSLSEARRALPRLEAFQIAAVEQPIRPGNLQEMALLRAHSRIPFLLDESAWTARDVAALALAGAADAVNVYVGKAGGILPVLEAVQVAQACGLGATLGSNLELGIAHAAMLHVLSLSSGFDLETFPPDVAAPMYYAADLVEPGFRIQDASVPVPTGPGLGVTLKEEVVRKYRAA